MTIGRGDSTLRVLRARVTWPLYLTDAGAWMSALVAGTWLRFDFGAAEYDERTVLLLCIAMCAAHLVAGTALSLYRGRFDVGSLDELLRVGVAALSTTAAVGLPVLIAGPDMGIPRNVPLVAAPIAFLIMALARWVHRMSEERASRPSRDAERALVYGAGVAGTSLVKRMRIDRGSPFIPVAFVDDAPEELGAMHCGVRVRGTGDQLARLARRTNATAVIVAICRADADLLLRITERAAEASLRVLVMPPLEELLDGRRGMTDLRDITIEDIVGRHPVDTDVATVAGYLAGKRVLVTGAGGSIGSELCRQIARFGPAELMMLDRDESALQAVQIDLAGHGLLHTDEVILADIRDAEAIRALMARRRPEVVFHAAALKHLPMLEQYPDEAWKTNVLGTRNVLEAAHAAGVETFVNISTDKAANPTSVLGHSKQHAERLTAAFAARGCGRYLSVRFGNVLGSRGSMVPVFTALIEAGGPLTVTHPDVTRYFMTIPEACQLVVQAGGIGRPGEVLILDMGEPVRILDVAKQMIRMSGRPIDIVFTGLRPHEKLHEDLIGAGEHDERPFHDKITHTRIEPLEPWRLRKSAWDALWREGADAGPARRAPERRGSPLVAAAVELPGPAPAVAPPPSRRPTQPALVEHAPVEHAPVSLGQPNRAAR
ncbi:polysaccharide biosynthesis protein [Agrococcus carbonis]|uniref:dTDP-glucose 4,6-dehydratase n=1 Tax=Agrococcus carbonis TaxID=684552 RepID=A0A1H1RGF5_9MICO|nr:nucleoside-diphosphate sugar epimerase/dehydratase [Agrococcus carbonis]SDS34778.1 dTDP-glucose 4,6-dehydratase [Agrococcus carbonis]